MSNTNPEPRIDQDGVPWCDERCHNFDGKRCELLGQRPDGICEPAVIELAASRARLIAEVNALLSDRTIKCYCDCWVHRLRDIAERAGKEQP